MKEKATAGIKLADVARYAGTSASTVSRVLNNQPGISEATRAIVLEALRTIGYNPEATGSVALVRDSRTRIDILICPLAEQKNPMELNYYGAMLKGIRQATDSSKINLKMTIFTGEAETLPKSENTAGVLLLETPSEDLRRYLNEAKIPFVILSNNTGTYSEDLVSVDKFGESLRLCGYLAGIGIRRLGLLLPRIDLIYCEGFRCGMARHGLPIADSDIHLTKNTDLSHYVAPVHRMLEEGNLPEALVVASYAAADFCTEMFRMKKIRVPEDIRLVAFTDEEGEDNPNYITMRFDSVEMGRLAMERLLRKIGQPERKPHHIIVPMRFSMKQDKEKK